MNNAIEEAQAALKSDKPKVFLPGRNGSISAVAAELGSRLRAADAELFVRDARVVEALPAKDKKAVRLSEMEPDRFRTWIEDYVLVMKTINTERGPVHEICSMTRDVAAAILKSPQFQKCLRPITRILSCAIPAYTEDGSLRLLHRGYNEKEEAYVSGPDDYVGELASVAEAKNVIHDVFSEFQFEDDGRSLSVAVAAMLTPYVRFLMRPGSTWPTFVYNANDQGAGKTLCAKIATMTCFGSGEVMTIDKDREEFRKKLATALLEGAQFMLFDNVDVPIHDGTLEAANTSSEINLRLLGRNKSIVGPVPYFYITGNGVQVRGDMASRVLWVHLFTPAIRPEDRVFRRDIEEEDLFVMRPRLLSACYWLVKSWVEAGSPIKECQSRHKNWARVVGSILCFHDFVNPTSRPPAIEGQMDAADNITMLFAAMDPAERYDTNQLIELCQKVGAFEDRLADWEGEDTDPRRKSAIRSFIGLTIARAERRSYGGRRIRREGKSRDRKYRVEVMETIPA